MRVAIIGAGPAGLSAAYELSRHGQTVKIFEQDPRFVGGISRTVEYKGYRFDIGGHRFFSKSPEVEAFWAKILGVDLLVRPRKSRIYYQNKFYDYPLKPLNAFSNMGLLNTFLCLMDYAKAQAAPHRELKTFEDWVVRHFGRRLFTIFFKTYTEKVWGIACNEISADWAAQRIKGLNLMSAITHALFPKRETKQDMVKTLIEEFYYPRLGPGMLWEKVGQMVVEEGAELLMGQKIISLSHQNGRIVALEATDAHGHITQHCVDHVISSMPIRSLVQALRPAVSSATWEAASALHYRDFITVALIINTSNLFPDNWIYIHDPSVLVGRIQNFGNWSPAMVPDPSTTCLGMEYFCFEGDGLWNQSDDALLALAESELRRMRGMDNELCSLQP
ncbi:NAD(P)/FAD-dependent oxidoreductase [Sulfobacillus thermotolerans]|uniref:NAD(P)/FAD-dependent oxidoreductase n=1 Tax=Sulfobacillus thermotolerans TaxID=338644 RepID=UPI003366CBDA